MMQKYRIIMELRVYKLRINQPKLQIIRIKQSFLSKQNSPGYFPREFHVKFKLTS